MDQPMQAWISRNQGWMDVDDYSLCQFSSIKLGDYHLFQAQFLHFCCYTEQKKILLKTNDFLQSYHIKINVPFLWRELSSYLDET